jgi:probable rRNA maturation factor
VSGILVLRNRQRACQVNSRLLREITHVLLRDLLRIDRFELGILLVSSSEISRLNATFLRHRGATDVITFDYAHSAAQAPRSPGFTHGEIFICPDKALTHARLFRTTCQSELIRYIIHGTLHLLGYDDTRPAARRRMKQAEDRLLRELARQFDLRKVGLQRRGAARFA